MEYADRIESVVDKVQELAEELTDIQFSLLRQALREVDTAPAVLEKQIGRAKRSLDKAAQILKAVEHLDA